MIDKKSLPTLNYPEADRLRKRTLDELEAGVKNDLLTDNGKVIAAVRFLYEDPKRMAAFGDNAAHTVAALKHIGTDLPEYLHLLGEAGVTLGQDSVRKVSRQLDTIQRFDATSHEKLLESVTNWEHVRRSLGGDKTDLGNIAEGVVVAAKENRRSFGPVPQDAPHSVAEAKTLYRDMVRPGLRKAREGYQGYKLETTIPPGYGSELNPIDLRREGQVLKGDIKTALGKVIKTWMRDAPEQDAPATVRILLGVMDGSRRQLR